MMSGGRTTQVLHVRLPDAEAEAVKQRARKADMSINEWLRKVIQDKLRVHKRGEK